VESLFELTRELGVDLIVVSFKEYIGYSLAELVDKASSLELPHSPCTYCGVVRRHAMNKIAEELGARKVATAHVLDDEIQTFLMNFLHGDWKGVLKLHPLTSRKLSGPVRIKPLRKVYEWEVATYAYLRGYRFQETECPYITYRPTLRARLRAKLLTVERELPGTLLKMMEFLDELLSVETDNMRESFKECPLCGALTSFERETCRLCELLRELNLGHAPRTLGALFRSSLRA
ncbi:MAG: TIGR00269 family protein, partial [Acidilobaceae archaeon]